MPRWAALLTVAALLVAGSWAYRSFGEQDPRPPRPNILIFVTDDQRASGTLQVMPNVRHWFSSAGTTFANAYTTTPLCCPARASIFSGRYAHNHGVRVNHLAHELDQTITIQRHLQDAGYRTAIAGKFLNQWGTGQPPAFFDRWAIFLEGEYYDRQWNIDGEVSRLPDYTNDMVREQALGFLDDFDESSDEDPWFLYVGTNAAHAPFTPEPRYADVLPGRAAPDPAMAERDITDKPELRRTNGRRRYVRRGQLRTLMSADDTVGRIFDRLEDLGELRDTFAIFMSDNGMQWGEHGYTGKRLPFSPSVKVPLIVRHPQRLRNETSNELVANIDVAPTVLEIAGAEGASAMDGVSLLSPSERTELLLEHWRDADTEVRDWASLVSLDSQYIEYYDGRGSAIWRGLYDLRFDPWQLDNLLAAGAGDPRAAAMARRLARYRSCVASSCP